MKNEPQIIDANETPEPEEISAAGNGDPSQKPNSDRLAAENRELKNTLRLNKVREAALDKLKEGGAISPNLIFGLIGGSLTFDAEDKPENLAELIGELRRTHPEQFSLPEKPASIDAGTGGNGMTKVLTADDLRQMTASEIARLDWTEVRRVLANDR